MLEPEYQGITCPKCHKREVYLDREIGFYCMICGQQYGTEEIRLLIETEVFQTDQAPHRKFLEYERGVPTKLQTDQMKPAEYRHDAAVIHEIPDQKRALDDRDLASHKQAIG